MYQSLKIVTLDFLYADKSVLRKREQLSESIIKTTPNNQKQLLVDVSVIIRGDAGTGIQRVVRALQQQLCKKPPNGYQVRFVFASSDHSYQYAPTNFSLNQSNENIVSESNKRVSVSAGDVFLGLDLAAHILPKHQNQLEHWKRNGVKIHILVYDLLPVLHPEWFHSKTTRNFYRWLRSVAILADSAICISKTVQADLNYWLACKYSFSPNALPVTVIPMGSDISASAPSAGLPENAERLLAQFKERPTALMVGTLEPRKGHIDVLDAFEKLWLKKKPINLVVVGKSGWKTDTLQQRLTYHPERDKQLFWLTNVSDQFLELIYEASNGLILASKGEGFGLPLIEALSHNKPVLARDLPVFKEIAQGAVTFFSTATDQNLDASLYKWLHQQPDYKNCNSIKLVSWEYCAHKLYGLLQI